MTTHINKNCAICNQEYQTPDTKRGRAKQTCSKHCSSKLASNNSYVDKNCFKCGDIVSARTSNMKPYCLKCSNTRYDKQKNCVICEKIFVTGRHDGSTCSKKCANDLGAKILVSIVCSFCGTTFQRPSSTYVQGRRHFCSKTCNVNQFSIENPTRYGGTWKRRRAETIARDNHRCLLCKQKENLEVHHFIKMTTFENPNDAHLEDNVGTFCNVCHKIVENKYESLTKFMKDIV